MLQTIITISIDIFILSPRSSAKTEQEETYSYNLSKIVVIFIQLVKELKRNYMSTKSGTRFFEWKFKLAGLNFEMNAPLCKAAESKI